jgi:hypothetical protein
MNRRALLGGFLVVVCLTTLWGVWRQRSHLAELRAEQQQLLAQRPANPDGSASPTPTEAPGASPATPQPALVVTPELLRLRNEVTRLTERRRELAGVRSENEQLRAQLDIRGTNGPGGLPLPPGYVRRSEARFVGYNTPEDTLQSVLWAARSHDLTNILQAFAPEVAEKIRAQAGESPQSLEGFWSQSVGLVGMRIVSRKPEASDGSITVEVEVVPGVPNAELTFRQINGQWKLASGF